MVPVNVGSKERREAVGRSVVSAVLVIKIVTRVVMRLWAIGGECGVSEIRDEMMLLASIRFRGVESTVSRSGSQR